MSVCEKVNNFLSMTELQLLHSQSTCSVVRETFVQLRERAPLHNVNSIFKWLFKGIIGGGGGKKLQVGHFTYY